MLANQSGTPAHIYENEKPGFLSIPCSSCKSLWNHDFFWLLIDPLCERDLGLLWTWKSSWHNEAGGFSVPWDKSGIRDDCVIGYDFSGRNKFESWSKKSISCIFVKTIMRNRFCSKGLGIMLFVLFKNDFCFLFPDCIYDRGFEDYLGYFFHLCWQE